MSYKMFYCPDDTEEAKAFQIEHDCKRIWASENQGCNGDNWIVYNSVDELPTWIQEYAKAQEKLNLTYKLEACPICHANLGAEETITAIQGRLLCNRCAVKEYEPDTLLEQGEEVVPSDIGIMNN